MVQSVLQLPDYSVPVYFHTNELSIEFFEGKMQSTLERVRELGLTGDELNLSVQFGPFSSPTHGVISLIQGRIIELHVLQNKRVISQAFKEIAQREGTKFTNEAIDIKH